MTEQTLLESLQLEDELDHDKKTGPNGDLPDGDAGIIDGDEDEEDVDDTDGDDEEEDEEDDEDEDEDDDDSDD